jgi:hypothetical protein
MLRLSLIALLALAVPSIAQQPALRLNFTPESEKFNEATKQYQSIWEAEGRRMAEAMEQVSGLKFQETDIQVIVYEGVSYSGFGDRPMRLRASYPEGVKKATLVHELGHRLKTLSSGAGLRSWTSTGCCFCIFMMCGRGCTGRVLRTRW